MAKVTKKDEAKAKRFLQQYTTIPELQSFFSKQTAEWQQKNRVALAYAATLIQHGKVKQQDSAKNDSKNQVQKSKNTAPKPAAETGANSTAVTQANSSAETTAKTDAKTAMALQQYLQAENSLMKHQKKPVKRTAKSGLRTKRLYVYLTDDEMTMFKREANTLGMKLTTYAKMKMLSGATEPDALAKSLDQKFGDKTKKIVVEADPLSMRHFIGQITAAVEQLTKLNRTIKRSKKQLPKSADVLATIKAAENTIISALGKITYTSTGESKKDVDKYYQEEGK